VVLGTYESIYLEKKKEPRNQVDFVDHNIYSGFFGGFVSDTIGWRWAFLLQVCMRC